MDDWVNVLIITGAVIVILVITLISIVSDRLDRNSYKDHIKDAVVGDYKLSAHTEDFHYWLICDGRSLNRHVYCKLFDVIGTAYGSADDESFNLPDARGRVPGLSGQGTGLTVRYAGQKIGSETHTLTVAELATHSHGITDPGHFHTFTTNNDDYNNSIGGTPPAFTKDAAPDSNVNWNTNSKTTGVTVNNTGSSTPFSIIQPTLIVGNLFIYGGIVDYHHHHPHPTPTPTPSPTPT
jgi:microcystin-dependent protein